MIKNDILQVAETKHTKTRVVGQYGTPQSIKSAVFLRVFCWPLKAQTLKNTNF